MQMTENFVIVYRIFGIIVTIYLLRYFSKQGKDVIWELTLFFSIILINIWPIVYLIILIRKLFPQNILKDDDIPETYDDIIQNLADEGYSFMLLKVKTPLPARVCRADLLCTEDGNIVLIRINGAYSDIRNIGDGTYIDRWKNTYVIRNHQFIMVKMVDQNEWIGTAPYGE